MEENQEPTTTTEISEATLEELLESPEVAAVVKPIKEVAKKVDNVVTRWVKAGGVWIKEKVTYVPKPVKVPEVIKEEVKLEKEKQVCRKKQTMEMAKAWIEGQLEENGEKVKQPRIVMAYHLFLAALYCLFEKWNINKVKDFVKHLRCDVPSPADLTKKVQRNLERYLDTYVYTTCVILSYAICLCGPQLLLSALFPVIVIGALYAFDYNYGSVYVNNYRLSFELEAVLVFIFSVPFLIGNGVVTSVVWGLIFAFVLIMAHASLRKELVPEE